MRHFKLKMCYVTSSIIHLHWPHFICMFYINHSLRTLILRFNLMHSQIKWTCVKCMQCTVHYKMLQIMAEFPFFWHSGSSNGFFQYYLQFYQYKVSLYSISEPYLPFSFFKKRTKKCKQSIIVSYNYKCDSFRSGCNSMQSRCIYSCIMLYSYHFREIYMLLRRSKRFYLLNKRNKNRYFFHRIPLMLLRDKIQ